MIAGMLLLGLFLVLYLGTERILSIPEAAGVSISGTSRPGTTPAREVA